MHGSVPCTDRRVCDRLLRSPLGERVPWPTPARRWLGSGRGMGGACGIEGSMTTPHLPGRLGDPDLTLATDPRCRSADDRGHDADRPRRPHATAAGHGGHAAGGVARVQHDGRSRRSTHAFSMFSARARPGRRGRASIEVITRCRRQRHHALHPPARAARPGRCPASSTSTAAA